MFNNRVCENILYHIHSIFIKTICVRIFRKHPRKLEIKSDGDISDGAFYHTSYKKRLGFMQFLKIAPR